MQTPKSTTLSLPDYRKFKIAAVILVVAGLAFAGGLGVAMLFLPSAASVPADIKQKAGFSVFVPVRLPGKYTVVRDSFSIQEETVVFKASDGAGGSIIFTEQKKPTNFNFDDFYKNQMKNAKVVDEAMFSTIIGKTVNEEINLVSVVTDDTWVLISTRTLLSEDSLKNIALSLKES